MSLQERNLITRLTNTAIDYYYDNALAARIQPENFVFNIIKAIKSASPDQFANHSLIRDLRETLIIIGFFLSITSHPKLIQRAIHNVALTTDGPEMVQVFVMILAQATNIQHHMIWMLLKPDILKAALEVIAKHNAQDVTITNANWLSLVDQDPSDQNNEALNSTDPATLPNLQELPSSE